MPDDEILGFWGKRPFLAKRIPQENQTSKPVVLPTLTTRSEIADTKPAETEPLPSWHDDPALFPHFQPMLVSSEINNQAQSSAILEPL